MNGSEARVREAFRTQSEHCARMGSPFYGQLAYLLAERLDRETVVGRAVLDWAGDPAPTSDALALRLLGALHALALGGDPLASVFPPHSADDDALWEGARLAMEDNAPFIIGRLAHPPQTNEVRRSAALFAGLLVASEATGLPLVLSELGASAGLNLALDRFGYDFGGQTFGDTSSPVLLRPEWDGPQPPKAHIRIVARAGCDLAPIDTGTDEGRRYALSFLWPDQTERIARTDAAIAISRRLGIRLDKADAADWLECRLAERHDGAAHIVFHSIAWQYFPLTVQERVRELVSEAGSRATWAAPLAWLTMESDGDRNGAALTLVLWPGGESRQLARVGFHGERVDWAGASLRPSG